MSELAFPTHAVEQLMEKFREAQARADERAWVTHERFNIFTTLLPAHDEVRLHTRFLHCLLDPKGYHDCKDLFLNLFFETLVDHSGNNHDGSQAEFNLPPNQTTWMVEKEASRGDFGQIDILLEQPNFGIAIENKIYANEQKEQLGRYANYLESRSVPGLVIFLTLNGRPSMTHKGKIPYMRISYANHILTWLDKCLRETYGMIPINQVLQQYRTVVLKLTGKNLETKAMKDISDFIIENPDIIRFRKQLNEGIKRAVETFFNILADEIKKELGLYGFEVRPLEHRKFGVHEYGALVLKTPNKMPFDIYIEYATGEDDEALYVGISGDFENQPPSPELNAVFKRLFEKLKAVGFVGRYENINWPTGWHTLIEGLDDDGIAKLLKTGPTKIASEVCGKIRSYITHIEKIYTEVIQQTNIQS
jgi:hypothetical protein